MNDHNRTEPNRTASRTTVDRRIDRNKAVGLRWAIGLVVVLALGFIAWEVLAPEHTPSTENMSPQQSGQDGGPDGGINQPPGVVPNQDQGGAAAPGAPADTGAGVQ
jgi:hypothetical protein